MLSSFLFNNLPNTHAHSAEAIVKISEIAKFFGKNVDETTK